MAVFTESYQHYQTLFTSGVAAQDLDIAQASEDRHHLKIVLLKGLG